MANDYSYCCTKASDPLVLAKIAAIAAPYRGREDMLIEVLRQAQPIAGNAVPEEVAAVVSEAMDIPRPKIYGVATFYAMFSKEERGEHIVRMCHSAPCHVRGAKALLEAFEKELGIQCGHTTLDGRFTLETCECLGVCDRAPAVMIDDEVYGPLTPADIKGVLAKYR